MERSANVPGYPAGIGGRSLVRAVLAALAIPVLRVKFAAGRHAVWAAVAFGMLALAAVEPVWAPLPVRVLKAAPAAPAPLPEIPPLAAEAWTAAQSSGPVARSYTWRGAAAAAWRWAR